MSVQTRYMEENVYTEGGDVLAWNKDVAMSFPAWEVVYRRMGLGFCVAFLSSWACCGVAGIPRACCGKEPRGRSGAKRAVVTSLSSFTCLTTCFRKEKHCLFIPPSYSSSGRDPRLLRWEGRNPLESCETLTWFFPSPGLGGLRHPPG